MKKKNQFYTYLFIFIAFTLILTSSCVKEEDIKQVPILTTTDAIDVTINTAKTGGSIISNGGAEIIEGGVCWGNESLPDISNNKTTNGKGVGDYSCTILGLSPNTKYYVRAFATNKVGTAYGNEICFTTGAVNTTDLTNTIKIISVTPTTGLINGQLTNFEVTVTYSLGSLQTGTLMIGFNNVDNINTSRMLSASNKIIDKGSDQHTFNVSTTVKNWGTEGDFYVYVNLSENPIPISWTPLANDKFILIPKQ